MSVKLDDMIFRKALASLARWDSEGVFIPRLVLNVSAYRLAQPDVVDRMKWVMEAAGISSERVGLEILEQVLTGEDHALVARNVAALRKAGLHITLDDFGTGRASIASLRELPFDQVKLDKSFCKGLTEDRDLKVMTSAMIALVKNLGHDVACVGIETEADRLVLEELGCDVVQGFLFAKPMAEDVFARWMAQVYAPPEQRALSA